MNTNNNNWTLGVVVCLMLLVSSSFTSCDDELDIIPKGKTTLENVTDLEALLNTEYHRTSPSSVTKFLANGVLCPK